MILATKCNKNTEERTSWPPLFAADSLKTFFATSLAAKEAIAADVEGQCGKREWQSSMFVLRERCWGRDKECWQILSSIHRKLRRWLVVGFYLAPRTECSSVDVAADSARL